MLIQENTRFQTTKTTERILNDFNDRGNTIEQVVSAVMVECKGNMKLSAQTLGISRSTLQSWQGRVSADIAVVVPRSKEVIALETELKQHGPYIEAIIRTLMHQYKCEVKEVVEFLADHLPENIQKTSVAKWIKAVREQPMKIAPEATSVYQRPTRFFNQTEVSKKILENSHLGATVEEIVECAMGWMCGHIRLSSEMLGVEVHNLSTILSKMSKELPYYVPRTPLVERLEKEYFFHGDSIETIVPSMVRKGETITRVADKASVSANALQNILKNIELWKKEYKPEVKKRPRSKPIHEEVYSSRGSAYQSFDPVRQAMSIAGKEQRW